MAIPLALTTVTVVERSSDGDPYEDPTESVLATGVRAVIGSPTGVDLRVGGDKAVIDAAAQLDPCEISRTCRLYDEQTEQVWDVAWVQARFGLGLDHVRVGLTIVEGGSSG